MYPGGQASTRHVLCQNPTVIGRMKAGACTSTTETSETSETLLQSLHMHVFCHRKDILFSDVLVLCRSSHFPSNSHVAL